MQLRKTVIITWMELRSGGWDRVSHCFSGKRIEKFGVQSKWKTLYSSLICEEHFVTVGCAKKSGVITGI